MSLEITDNITRITNTCECEGENGEWYDCDGMCWNDTLEDFTNQVQPLFDIAEKFQSPQWRLEGLPLWNRTVSGTFSADNAEELLRSITIRGEWTLRYEVKDGVLLANLSHHDAPMGGAMTIVPVEGAESDWS